MTKDFLDVVRISDTILEIYFNILLIGVPDLVFKNFQYLIF